MTVHEPSLPHAHLLYRSMMQWVGGAGVIVLALAILRTPGAAGGYSLYRAEGREKRLRPSVLDDSIASYGSVGMELLHVPPMISGAIALPVLYVAFSRRNPLELLRGTTAVPDPIREGSFQFMSALTTTGWQTSTMGNWGTPEVLFIVLAAMLIGGSAGATAGGIKIQRAVILARGAVWQATRAFLPKSAVKVSRVGEERYRRSEMEELLGQVGIFVLMYLSLLCLSMLLLSSTLGPEFTLTDIVLESASVQGTVGLSSGITTPDMPIAAEIMFIVQMWAGRLEIIPLLVAARAVLRGFAP